MQRPGVGAMTTREDGAAADAHLEDAAHTTLRGHWLLIARAAWVAVVVLAIGLFIAGVPHDYDAKLTVCAEVECHEERLLPEDAEALRDLGLSESSGWAGGHRPAGSSRLLNRGCAEGRGPFGGCVRVSLTQIFFIFHRESGWARWPS